MVFTIILKIFGGLFLLTAGAESLVRGSAGLAERVGFSRLIIGLTIVAFGTSSPELVVSVNAVITGKSAIALGNVIGSNIANIALIVGLSSIIHPIRIDEDIVRFQIPFLIVISFLLCVQYIDGILQRSEGAFLFCAFLVFMVIVIRKAQIKPKVPSLESPEKTKQNNTGIKNRFFYLLIMIVLGLILLIFGADLFIKGAVFCTELLGISQGVVGLTIVALGTSLPELATSIVAAYKGESDIAIGNVVGSNMFNILAILGIASVLRPIPQLGISMLDFIIMLGTTILILPLSKSGRIIDRREGFLMVLIYIFYILVSYVKIN